jgi:ribosomal-protein-serine acetyltransferase
MKNRTELLQKRKELEPLHVEGTCVSLEPATTFMASELLAACLESKADLLRFMPWDCWTSAATIAFLEGAEEARREGMRFEYALTHKNDQRFLGMMCVKVVDPFTPVGEVGYWVRSTERGKGVAKDALLAVVLACEEQGLFTHLEAWTSECNLASQEVLAASGFTRNGEQPLGQCCHGTWHDMLRFERSLKTRAFSDDL